MIRRLELVIITANDVSSGIYDTKLEATDAAAVDGLTARYGTTTAGFLVDEYGVAWFHFEIRTMEEADG